MCENEGPIPLDTDGVIIINQIYNGEQCELQQLQQ